LLLISVLCIFKTHYIKLTFLFRLLAFGIFSLVGLQTVKAQLAAHVGGAGSLKLDNSEVRKLHSTYLGDDLLLYVCLPRTYNEGKAHFPVLYLTDADDFVMMSAEISRLMSVNREIPEMIVVGLAYGAHITKPGNHRNRDYAPSPDPRFPESGGAGRFINCLEKEIFSITDSLYRTVKTERTFYGTSLGALFGTYVLFNKPEMFNRYILASPSLWWGEKGIFKDE
jgi:predicted alpha/beta superfamily hydrolase